MFRYVMLRILVNLTIRNAPVWSVGYIGVPVGPIHYAYAQSTVVTTAVFTELYETVAHRAVGLLYSQRRGNTCPQVQGPYSFIVISKHQPTECHTV
jgi:hypothetical protein